MHAGSIKITYTSQANYDNDSVNVFPLPRSSLIDRAYPHLARYPRDTAAVLCLCAFQSRNNESG